MRAKEFINEFTINVPVTINVPLADFIRAASEQEKTCTPVIAQQGNQVINPGLRYGEDGEAKWSPPLQQHLDTVKDSVGPSQEDPITIADEDDFHEPNLDLEAKKIDLGDDQTSVLDRLPSMPG